MTTLNRDAAQVALVLASTGRPYQLDKADLAFISRHHSDPEMRCRARAELALRQPAHVRPRREPVTRVSDMKRELDALWGLVDEQGERLAKLEASDG